VRILRSPVVQFLLLSVLTMVVIVVGTNQIAQHVAESEAVAEAQNTTEVLAHSVARPAMSERLLEAKPGAIDKFLVLTKEGLLIQDPTTVRINLWLADGTLVFTNRKGLVGEVFTLDADQRRVLEEGGTGYQIMDPRDPENAGTEDEVRRLVRVYTPLEVAGQRVLFEAYFSLDKIETRRSEIIAPFRWITIGSLALLLIVLTPILWLLTRRLTNAGEERERLLSTAIDASDAERRRIARDLHDGVVQDLAGTTFAISAVQRDPATSDEARETLESATSSLRDSLKALRSLLAEIHPPELQAGGLATALADLIAPAATAGIQASVSVDGIEGSSDAAAALVWRVAQEAVRNAIRHSGASTLAVTVRRADGRMTLEVVDDGVGFDPEVRDPDRFGLRGLRSLVTDVGGRLEVRSAVGEGTTVRMEVDVQ
jgi:signal transduction histidine kinase